MTKNNNYEEKNINKVGKREVGGQVILAFRMKK